MSLRETIAAISTAPGRAGIGVVRLSGPSLSALLGPLVGRPLVPRRATHTAFHAADGAVIDEGIALFFPAPHSYTGQDVLELQGHGGPVVLNMLLRRCIELGARIARPGEFTERAFLAGKLDLAQAESVIDLIDASTTQAARSAMRALRGEFSALIQEVSGMLVDLRALAESTLDFPEEDIDFLARSGADQRLADIRARVDAIRDAARQGALLREGINIALAGEPNVGKSSLLNRLAGEELAIVTDVPGTTRDPIRQGIEIEGVPVHVVDTAGLRETNEAVERIGVERAWQAIVRSDILVLVTDTASAAAMTEEIIARVPPEVPRIRVVNKIDLVGASPRLERSAEGATVWLSAKTGAGLHLLRAALLEVAGWHAGHEGVFLARERHLSALAQVADHLARAGALGGELELFAEELRLAHVALMRITGEFSADDLLGEIFGRFCIGK